MGMGQRLAIVLLAIGIGFMPVRSQAIAAPKLTAEQARKTIISGIKAYEAGQTKNAVSSLSYALSSGGLASKDMAKALYYRGLSYRKQGKQAQAISDLTSAIWLKGGLSEKEKANAISERAKAYTSAGVKNQAPSLAQVPRNSQQAATVASSAQTQTRAAVAKANQPVVAKGQSPSAFTTTTTVANAQPSASRQPSVKVSDAYSPPPRGISASGLANGLAPNASHNQPSSSSSSPNLTAESVVEGVMQPLQGVGSFFSNLFSGGANNGTTAANAATATATPVTSAGPASAVSAWSSTTQLATGSTTKGASSHPNRYAGTRVAAVDTRQRSASPSVVGTKPAAGDYLLQVAVLKSRAEADALITTLSQKHASKFGTRNPTVRETVFGNMGKFYRVQVGPYANTREPKSVCSKIAGDGYDCFVIKK